MPVISNEIVKEVVEALGLPACVTKIDIKMHVGEVVTVTVEFLPYVEQLKKVIPILEKYELVEKKC